MKVAKTFAATSKLMNDDMDKVILRIRMENKKGKHYIALDRKDFTMYPEEKEVLL